MRVFVRFFGGDLDGMIAADFPMDDEDEQDPNIEGFHDMPLKSVVCLTDGEDDAQRLWNLPQKEREDEIEALTSSIADFDILTAMPSRDDLTRKNAWNAFEVALFSGIDGRGTTYFDANPPASPGTVTGEYQISKFEIRVGGDTDAVDARYAIVECTATNHQLLEERTAKPLLTVPEVAERLRLSKSSAYALVDSGKLRSYHVGPNGGAIRVKLEDLTAYLESVGTGGPAEANGDASGQLEPEPVILDSMTPRNRGDKRFAPRVYEKLTPRRKGPHRPPTRKPKQ